MRFASIDRGQHGLPQYFNAVNGTLNLNRVCSLPATWNCPIRGSCHCRPGQFRTADDSARHMRIARSCSHRPGLTATLEQPPSVRPSTVGYRRRRMRWHQRRRIVGQADLRWQQSDCCCPHLDDPVSCCSFAELSAPSETAHRPDCLAAER